jgi:hypothetical protein
VWQSPQATAPTTATRLLFFREPDASTFVHELELDRHMTAVLQLRSGSSRHRATPDGVRDGVQAGREGSRPMA